MRDGTSHIEDWCKEHAITEVEALMPDMSGVDRGKVMPVAGNCRTLGLNLPEALVLQTVTGDFAEEMHEPAVVTQSLRTLFEWLEAGALRPAVSETMPLERASEAMQRILRREARGKIVLTTAA